jgi:hypothetical protein
MEKTKVLFIIGLTIFIFINCEGKQKKKKKERIPRILEGYQNVLWGESSENTKLLFQNNNYKFGGYFGNQKLLFEGKVSDYEAYIFCEFNEDKLYRIEVIIRDKITDQDYQKFIIVLTEKYGEKNPPLSENDKIPYWSFDNNCSIMLFMRKELSIIYQNRTLRPQEAEKEVSKNDL